MQFKMNFSTVVQMGLLMLILVVVFALKIIDAQSKPVFSHDGGISILAASGNQGKYEQIREDGLTNRWVSSENYSNLVMPPQAPNYQKIATDLNLHDIHPPLFFWTLGAWMNISIETPPYMLFIPNIIFVCISILIFYALIRQRFSPDLSLLFTTAFAFSPPIAAPLMFLRQYELMMFSSVCIMLFITLMIRLSGNQKEYKLVLSLGLFLATLVGLMSQMQFVIISFAAVISLALINLPRRIILLCILPISASFLAFLLINREFMRAFLRHRDKLQEGGVSEFVYRIKRFIVESEDLFGLERLTSATAIIALLCFAIYELRGCRNEKTKSAKIDDFWIAFGAISLFLYLFMYFTLQAPRHAVGSRYFLPFLPGIFAIVSIILYRSRSVFLRVATPTFFLLTSSSLLMSSAPKQAALRNKIDNSLNNASAIYFANSSPGMLSPILPFIPKGKDMLVADRYFDMDEFDEVSSHLHQGDVVSLRPGYGVSQETIRRQKEILTKKFQLVPLEFENMYTLH